VRSSTSQLFLSVFVAALCAVPAASRAQFAPDSSGPRLAPEPFSALRWRNIGPAVFGGRFTDIAVARTRGQPDQLYIAASTGGVFKSVNGGISWTPVFDAVNAMMSMGDLAIAPSNQNIVWVGTGEPQNPPHRWGDGVYKSVDGGRTWQFMGLRDTRHIGRITIHPTNPDIVYVAAQGNIWGPSTERGVFRTTDGGRTWRKILYVGENTGANDVLMDPTNPEVLLATTYTRQRRQYGGIPTGPGSDMYKSVDGGEHWTKIEKGLPTTEKGRMGLSWSTVDPKLVYADVEVRGAVYPGGGGNPADCPPEGGRANSTRGGFESGQGGVYRSTDGGDSWEHVNSRIDQPSGFFIQIRADPVDRNRVYRLGTGLYVSDDQGKTFRTLATNLHGDYFALWIDPDNNNRLIVANDGGLAYSYDRAITWDHRSNIAVAQFYETYVDNHDPFWVCGGAQDNGMWCTPSATRDRNGISNEDAWMMGGGDGMHVRVDPHDTTFAIFEAQSGAGNQGSMSRLNTVTRERQIIKPGIGRPVSCFDAVIPAAGRVQPPLRWGWDTPVLFSEVTPGVVYTAANVLFKSTDRGSTWKQISPDLTSRVNRDTIMILGRALGAANYSPNGTNVTDPTVTPTFGQITSIGESKLDPKVLYTGSDDGIIQVSRDGGATWTVISSNIAGHPPFRYVSTVFPSQHVAGRVYATFEGHGLQDDKAYVYVSNDYGRSWRAITNGLPDAPVWRITEHPRDPNVLVVAHVRGVHFSNDAGVTWHSLNTNLPTVPVTSVVFQARDNALVAGTYGRGIWILDDAAPLSALTARALDDDAVLVSTTKGRQWEVYQARPNQGAGYYFAPNPDFDPAVTYYLKNDATADATITISDAQGNVVRTLSGPARRGINRVSWDMHMSSAVGDAPLTTGRRVAGTAAAGPQVLPGRYTATVRVPGVARELRGTIDVVADPLVKASAADQASRQRALMQLYDLQKTLTAARTALRPFSAQSSQLRADLGASAATDSLIRRVNALQTELDRLVGISASMMRLIESFNGAPLSDQAQQVTWAADDVGRAVARLNQLTQTDIPGAYTRAGKTPPRIERVTQR
jgi:photosystem II stability/assembly factor-like uncharacterized protein